MRRALVGLAMLLAGATPAQAARLRGCGNHFRCGRISVPLDYGDPGGRRISLYVAVRPARQPARRIGALFVNYGGPGADAVQRTREYGYGKFGALGRRFDVVAVDPRGTGRSRPAINCRVNQERNGLYRLPFPRTASAKTLARARRYAQRCAARNPVLNGHLSTANAARDLDAVRSALGYDRITYVGFSYGTLLGATYAALFPDRIRAVVLDGPVDPQTWLNDPFAAAKAQTDGFELALKRYFRACHGHRRTCRWPGRRTPGAAYDRLIRRADRRPIRSFTGARVDGDVINAAVAEELYSKHLWRELTGALSAAVRGNATTLRLIAEDFYNGPLLDRFFMITGADARYPTMPQPFFAAARAARRENPHFFFNRGFGELPFAFTTRDPDAFYGPFTLPDAAPTALVVATTGDPATPYAQGAALVRELGRARLLTMRGDGHTAYGGESRCVDRAVNAYVNRLVLPAPGLSCRQDTAF